MHASPQPNRGGSHTEGVQILHARAFVLKMRSRPTAMCSRVDGSEDRGHRNDVILGRFGFSKAT